MQQDELERTACWKRLISLFVCISRDSSQPGGQFAPVLEWSPHDSKQSFRSNVRSFNPLEKRGCQGRPAPDRGPGVSPGSFPFSRAAAGGAQKERKGVFRGIQAPQACLPRTPAKGWPPFAIPLEKRIEVYRTDVLKVCFVSCIKLSPEHQPVKSGDGCKENSAATKHEHSRQH